MLDQTREADVGCPSRPARTLNMRSSTTVASVRRVWSSPGQVWEGSMSVAVWSGSLVAWERELAALKARIGPVFGRAEVRATAGAFLDGLLSGVARKTGWLLAEQAGLD